MGGLQLEPLLGALGRGLWDCTARDVFRYTEALQEGQENRVRF